MRNRPQPLQSFPSRLEGIRGSGPPAPRPRRGLGDPANARAALARRLRSLWRRHRSRCVISSRTGVRAPRGSYYHEAGPAPGASAAAFGRRPSIVPFIAFRRASQPVNVCTGRSKYPAISTELLSFC